MSKAKTKIKKVTAKVYEQIEYIAETRCPYCKANNNSEIDEDGVIITETCWKCRKNYEVKIPAGSI